MTRNPSEECPPDEIVRTLTIRATLEVREHGGARVQGRMWKVEIPEINLETYTRNLTKLLAIELAKVEELNEEIILGEEAWHKDEAKLYATTHGGKDHEADQRRREADKWAHYRSFAEEDCDTPPVDRSHSLHS